MMKWFSWLSTDDSPFLPPSLLMTRPPPFSPHSARTPGIHVQTAVKSQSRGRWALHFLCSNQGGICSLADTSPLTCVSRHIHYSFRRRWASVCSGSTAERSGGWAVREGGGRGRGVWWAPLIPALLQLPSQTGVQGPPHPQSFRQRQRRWSNSWVKPKFPAFHLKLLFLAPLLVFLLVTGTNHLDFLTSRLRRQQSSQGTLGLFKGQREDVCESSLCN